MKKVIKIKNNIKWLTFSISFNSRHFLDKIHSLYVGDNGFQLFKIINIE